MSTPNNCMRDEDSRGAMLEAEHKGCFDGQQHSTIHRKIKKSIEGGQRLAHNWLVVVVVELSAGGALASSIACGTSTAAQVTHEHSSFPHDRRILMNKTLAIPLCFCRVTDIRLKRANTWSQAHSSFSQDCRTSFYSPFCFCFAILEGRTELLLISQASQPKCRVKNKVERETALAKKTLYIN
eukprot:1157818-Pelagomonas_calceolata.AAC.3